MREPVKLSLHFTKSKKNRLIEQKDSSKFLLLHDFTQLQVQGTFYQDLIIVLYCFNPELDGKLQTEYFHFVGSSSDQKNDIGFVTAAWKYLIKDGFFDGCSSIMIFSDGGPKHFKITSCMSFFAAMQKHLGIKISYNFFGSNHGHSVCDVAAAHAKNKMNVTQRDRGLPLNSPKEIARTISTIKNSDAVVAISDSHPGKIATFNKIRTCHKFEFSNDFAYGYALSTDVNILYSWKLPDNIFF